MTGMALRATRTVTIEPHLPGPLEPLRTIAHNLWWTWNGDATALFERMSPARWEGCGHNPVRLLQLMPPAELDELAANPGFLAHLKHVQETFAAYMARPRRDPFGEDGGANVIAYFSLEFALTESLPMYSGGLGVLAGDHLKSASDLCLPLVGVGLLYNEGYFQQVLGPDGWQREEYHPVDLAMQPMDLVLTEGGGPLAVRVPLEGRHVTVHAWRLQVGQVPLYLLDTNTPENSDADRAITSRLYGGDLEMRLQQEMVLGVGGVRVLRALGLRPAACHMNEGHSALLGLERIRVLMEEAGATFDEAALPVTAATVFTTHTPVAAGIDLFPSDLVHRQASHFHESLGMDAEQFLALGRSNRGDGHEPFSMALLGLRLSGFRNGVSQMNGRVARDLWASAWPELPPEEVPIAAVTNGVHLPTWVAPEIADLFDRFVGPGWREDPVGAAWERMSELPASELWDTHERQRERLVSMARAASREAAAARGVLATDTALGQALDPHVLTIGFARRFAGYKRASLIMRDPGRLARILNHPDRPIQLVFAGKAHPRDEPGKRLIREVMEFSRRPEFRDRIVVLEGYDLAMARSLVQGCDVWLNTPLRPLEASGTSGMKATANGALHLSVMDGWWWEAYRPGLGWAIGANRPGDDPDVQDAFDADSLYDLLENEVGPLFYQRDADGLPQGWVARMKASVAAFAPQFNTNRMVGDYNRVAYGPAAESWRRLTADGLAPARALSAWIGRVRQAWPRVQVVGAEGDDGRKLELGAGVEVTAHVDLDGLEPGDLHVDVVYGEAGVDGTLHPTGERRLDFLSREGGTVCTYAGSFEPGMAGRVGWAIRVMPGHPDLHNPFATGLVRWS